MKRLRFLLIMLFTALILQSCVTGAKVTGKDRGYDYKAVIAKIAIEELKLRYQTIEFDIRLDSTKQKVVQYLEQGRKLFTVKVDSLAHDRRRIIVTPDYNKLEELLLQKQKKYEKLVRRRR
ncbi:hypothetical protein [uncultured Microscilla sp.]|uniref:hypothetical protein n=1 Tax=uncultured Microscilla sp. TaxID=432653 RepID=UPI002620C5C7|nr:hypothetical protein [uncultured Microscilla sp.]